MSAEQPIGPPPSTRFALKNGLTIAGVLVDTTTAQTFYGVSSIDNAFALYALPTGINFDDILYPIDYSSGLGWFGNLPNNYILVQALRYGKTPPPTSENLVYLISQGPAPSPPIPAPLDTTQPHSIQDFIDFANQPANKATWYLVDGGDKVSFQTTDKTYAYAYIKVYGGGVQPSVGPSPTYPVK